MKTTHKRSHETELVSGISSKRVSASTKKKIPSPPPSEDDNNDRDDSDENIKETDTLLPLEPIRLLPEERKLLQSTLFDDFCVVFHDVKYVAPLLAILFGFIGFIIVLDPFTAYPRRPTPMSQNEFQLTRPVLSVDEMANIYVNTFYGETIFELPEPFYDTVSLKFHTTASKSGHFQPPEIFYSGVIYGITSENSHNSVFANRRLLFDSTTDEEYHSQLFQDLTNMDPKPSNVFPRLSRNNETNWKEFGYAVYFNLQDLEAQGYLSSDTHAPWKRTLQPILKIARKYRQIYVTQWYPAQFGSQDPIKLKDNLHLHETVVRQIIPTRTGLNNIKSTGAVWLWMTNGTRTVKAEEVIRKEWTKDDNWTHYPTKRQLQDKDKDKNKDKGKDKDKTTTEATAATTGQ